MFDRLNAQLPQLDLRQAKEDRNRLSLHDLASTDKLQGDLVDMVPRPEVAVAHYARSHEHK